MMGPEIAGIKAFNSKSLIPAGGAAAVAAAGMNKNKKGRSGKLLPIVNIPHGYMGIRMRFDRPQKRGWLAQKLGREGDFHGLCQDGWRFAPTHSVEIFSVQEKQNNLEGIISDKRGDQHHVKTSVWWTIGQDYESVYNALFRNENGELIDSVAGFCAAGLRQVFLAHNREDLEDKDTFNNLMHEACSEDLDDYGVKIVRSRLIVAEKTIGHMLLEAAHISAPNNATILAALSAGQESPYRAEAVPHLGIPNGNTDGDNGMHIVA